jgi:drug/metabolite transporter (DMT)-like permease
MNGTDHRQHRPLLGVFLKLSAVTLTAGMTAAAKFVGSALPVGEVVFARTATALLVLLVIAWRARALATLSIRAWSPHLVRTSSGTLGMFTWFLALTRMPLADATALSYSTPVFATILAAVAGERLHAPRWLALAAGIGGVLVMIVPRVSLTESSHLGVMFALASSLFAALSTMSVRHMGRTQSSFVISFQFALPTTLAAASTAVWGWTMPDARLWLGLALVGLLGTGVSLLGTAALRRAEVSLIAPLEYAGMVAAVPLGYFLFGELPEPAIWVGAPLVIGAGLLILWSGYRRPPES